MIGQVLGNYRLVAEIGKGGMAKVYLAEHVVIGVQVAVKVLLPSFIGNQAMIQRFLTEAHATAAVKHPGIIDIIDFGRLANGGAYLIMEYLQGETLHRRMRRERRLPLEQALHITRQIATALSAAHRAGIIHRDLKPDNIFLVPDDEVTGGERAKILDFGIAKLAINGLHSERSATKTGVIIGTPDYMPPEQCKGLREIDHRADLYSLGCILFKMLTGRTPFAEHATGEVISCHVLKAPPRPESLASNVPPNVSALILKLLEKEPQDRFASADELLTVLERAGSSSLQLARAPTDPTVAGHDAVFYPPTPPPLPPDTADNAIRGHTPVSTLSGAAQYHTVAIPEDMPQPRRSGLMRYMVVLGAAVLLFGGAAFSTVQLLSGDTPNRSALSDRIESPGVTAAVGSNADDAAERGLADSARTTDDDQVEDGTAGGAKQPVKQIIRIEVTSSPEGAEVFQMPQGVRVGRTPAPLELEMWDGEYLFHIRHPGHEDYRLEVNATKDDTYHVELKRAAKDKSALAEANRSSKKRRKAKRRRANKPKANGDKDNGKGKDKDSDDYDDVGLMELD